LVTDENLLLGRYTPAGATRKALLCLSTLAKSNPYWLVQKASA